MYKSFIFGLLMTITGSFMFYIYRLVAEAVRFSAGMTETIHFTKSLYILPTLFLVIGLPFVIIIPFMWLNKWAKKNS